MDVPQSDEISGFCGLQWQNETDPNSGKRKYKLANFETEADAIDAGWSVTHRQVKLLFQKFTARWHMPISELFLCFSNTSAATFKPHQQG